MRERNKFAAPMARRALVLCASTALAATFVVAQAIAQQPAPKAQPKAAAPKAQQKGAPPAQSEPAQGEQPPLVFTPWTKICPTNPEAGNKKVCMTGKDGSVESGMPIVAAILIEPDGDPKKILRITLPLGMALQPGTRVVVDQGQPMTAPYSLCLPTGCLAEYEASGELIGNMKKGKGLAVQGLNGSGQVVTVVLPLNDFAKAYDAPPTDLKVFEEQQKKRFEELQKKKQ